MYCIGITELGFPTDIDKSNRINEVRPIVYLRCPYFTREGSMVQNDNFRMLFTNISITIRSFSVLAGPHLLVRSQKLRYSTYLYS